jgi:hypothetical protein
MTVKRYALATTLSIFVGMLLNGGAQAAAIELSLGDPAHASVTVHSPAASRIDPADMPAMMSELPEPEVLAMMLVGVILIGYRVSRDSSEKFK